MILNRKNGGGLIKKKREYIWFDFINFQNKNM